MKENKAKKRKTRSSFIFADQEDEVKLVKLEELAELDWGRKRLGVVFVI
jgi:hypothetical protein